MAVFLLLLCVAFMSTVQAQTNCLSCGDNNGGCRSDQECTIDNSTDYPTNYYSDSYNGSEHRRCPIQTFVCKEFPYVYCSDEMNCDSDNHCLIQRFTGMSVCLKSCNRDNGGCADDEVCITEAEGVCQSGVACSIYFTCLSLNEARGDCSPGQVRCNTPGNEICVHTCESFLAGPSCYMTEYCYGGSNNDYSVSGSGDTCMCPDGLVIFRDRCVDKRECYTLVNDPPDPNPLPLDRNSVLLLLKTSEGNTSAIDDYALEEFGYSLRNLLSSEGYGYVDITTHASYLKGITFHAVLKFSANWISSSSATEIARFIINHSDRLPIYFTQVTTVDALVYPFVLSAGAKAGVAVAVLVVCAAVFTPVGIFVAIQMYKEEKKKTSVPYSKQLDQPRDVPAGSRPVQTESTNI